MPKKAVLVEEDLNISIKTMKSAVDDTHPRRTVPYAAKTEPALICGSPIKLRTASPAVRIKDVMIKAHIEDAVKYESTIFQRFIGVAQMSLSTPASLSFTIV